MTLNGWLQILLYLAVIFVVTKPVGIFMAKVFNRERTLLDPVLRPFERLHKKRAGTRSPCARSLVRSALTGASALSNKSDENDPGGAGYKRCRVRPFEFPGL